MNITEKFLKFVKVGSVFYTSSMWVSRCPMVITNIIKSPDGEGVFVKYYYEYDTEQKIKSDYFDEEYLTWLYCMEERYEEE